MATADVDDEEITDGPPKAIVERMLPGFVCMRWRPTTVKISRALSIPRLLVKYYGEGDEGNEKITANVTAARRKECAATVPLRPSTKAKVVSDACAKRYR